ncbi:hypothetical protein NA57DRAFT_42075, partial [Rhizodiscina lignyota]
EAVDPQIHVPGIGPLQSPLAENQALELIDQCHQAPFGKGSETIVDVSVRRTWEMNPDEFEIQNPAWTERVIPSIVENACKKMGISSARVDAELYKMLLYEKGAMFKAHQDTEKCAGMFGTLVVCLSSSYGGGTVRASHAGKTKYLPEWSSRESPYFVCWYYRYSDVKHEVKEVTSGYRWVLTYNLLNKNPSQHLSATDKFFDATQLRRTFRKWNNEIRDGSMPDKLIYMLDHEYTDESLRLGTLKGNDLARSLRLKQVGEELEFSFFLANVERETFGECEPSSGCEDDYDSRDKEDDDNDSEEERDELKLRYSSLQCSLRF